jgi:hypothetical protein
VFAQSWEDQQDFWRQFVTRVPALEPGTVVVVSELPPKFMSDLSFMMTLNWLYDLEPEEAGLDYGLFFWDMRGLFKTIEAGMPVVYDWRMVTFESDLDHSLLIAYRTNNCLYVFDQRDGYQNPNARHVDPRLVEHTNPGQINLAVERFENWPEFFAPIPEDNWCYYYEWGELELQRGNYAEVARIGDLAFSSGVTPKRSWERAPFIEGYGFMERWQDALRLTDQAMRYSFTAESLYCNIWARLETGTPNSDAKKSAIEQVSELLTCPNESD